MSEGMGSVGSVLDDDDAVLGLVAEDPGLHPLRNGVELVVDAGDSKQGQDVDYHTVSQKVYQDGLEVKVNAVLHAVSSESDDHWTQQQEP